MECSAQLDEIEYIILQELRKNSRIDAIDISKKVSVSEKIIENKISLLKKKCIKKNTVLLDFSKLGYDMRITYIIKSKLPESLKRFLMESKNVNTVLKINDGHDYMFEAIFMDDKDKIKFSRNLITFGIEKIEEYTINKTIKQEEFNIPRFK